MARIPDHEIERLKWRVSVERLIESAGIELKPHGKDRVGRCPFHDDKTPSLVVSAKTNLWHCLGACQVGGSVIDWVMRFEGVSFRRAVELLRQEIGEAPASVVGESLPSLAAETALAEPALMAGDDAALLDRVIDYYHATLKQSPEAQAYLQSRGLDHPGLVDTFRLGYANRTLGYQLPIKQLKAGAEIRGALQRIGVLRESGHEHFNGSLVVPVITPAGEIVEVYGRKVLSASKLRAGTPLHLYLPGPHRGVFNESGLVGHEEVILCEALIDALTFWCAGYRNVTCAYGIEGFTAEILEAFRRHGIKRVLIAYDADEAGNGAADKLAGKLLADGFECYRCRFPKGMDANAYALAVKPAIKSLGVVIRQAEWMGKALDDVPRPTSRSMQEVLAGDVCDVAQRVAAMMTERGEVVPMAAVDQSTAAVVDVPFLAAEPAAAKEEIPALAQAPEPVVMPEPPAYRVPPTAPEIPVEISENGELRVVLGDRAYTVRGIEKNTSYEQLRVWLKVARGEFFHVDTVELYHAKQRGGWLKQASIELGLSDEVLRSDLGKLLRVVEQRQDALIRAKLQPKAPEDAAPALSEEQREGALVLLKDPRLIERIVADVEATGVVGEASNALVAYLACVSRKLDKPLAILIQSTSAAGKSTLMDAVLALMPEAERVQYSAMTGQSLFYLGETSMKHKVLAIAEEEGVRQAAYALKLLQSQGELTIASTGKDPITGQLVTQEYRVEGPVMLFLTTTAIDIDEELLNRCLVLTINESREQTAAIQRRQRSSRTLDGLLAKAKSEDVLAAHRAAQTLLRPLAVVNPYAEQLTFASDRVRLRRDHQKYLALIDSIALLHQYQRPIRSAQQGGLAIEYIEVTLTDIALANRLAHEVLGRSLDELPPQTRRVLGAIQTLVDERAHAQGIERCAVRFTRRELRDRIGVGDTQLRVHVERLAALEYVVTHSGRNGQRFSYELAFDGDVASQAPQAVGLIAAESLGTTVNLAGEDGNLAGADTKLAGRLRPASGQHAVSLRVEEMLVPARPDANLLTLAAALPETALLGSAPPPRRNGASYPGPARN
ncbi:MAG: toprim domain-containing protein [Xanthomonadales bacterium]|nr:toprim domain-containing protein [Xanthomonadales bacterium]